MTAEKYRQVRNVFEAALDQSETDRTAWVAEACAGDQKLRSEVDELLRQHQKCVGVLDTPAAGTAAGQRMEGRRLGAWEILREIGRGGMGVVYLARRADGSFQMSAAVKVLNTPFASEELRKRFRQERDILAKLTHPNIARLLDGGTTEDGLPYLVMEFVNGEPLTDWCDERRASIGERLELMEQLCQVVDYLHKNKVIHRDLKPGNVLVDSNGKLKLLDFGISKLADPTGEQSILLTRSGMHLLTPEYASPEQVTGEAITPQTDIYALGVIAYELLSGHKPHRLRNRAIQVMMRAICEEEPERPSTVVTQTNESESIEPGTVGRLRRTSPEQLSQRLRGDLDEVVMKALRKEPMQRYLSAMDMAQDVSAQRDGRRIVAQGEPATMSWLKWLGRSRGFVLAAMAVVFMVATGAVTLHVWAIVYALAALAAWGLWKAFTDPAVVRQLVKPAVFWTVTGVAGVSAATVMRYQVGSQTPSLWLYSIVVVFVINCGLAAQYLLRARSAGFVLLDASPQAGWPIRILLACCLLAAGAQAITFLIEGLNTPANLTHLFFYFGVINPSVFLSRKVELRLRGIVSFGVAYPWDQIQSWMWDYSAHNWSSRLIALRLELKNKRLGGSATIWVPKSKQDEVSLILTRFLEEWPTQPTEFSAPRRWTWPLGFAAVASTLLAVYLSLHPSQFDRLVSPSSPASALKIRTINGLEYVRVPAGSFLMGCSLDDDNCDANEKPAHEVKIEKPFWIGRTEVTNAAMFRYQSANKALHAVNLLQDSDYPVTMVSWTKAERYCKSFGLRLPTEKEWEYAARAGTTTLRYGALEDIAQRQTNLPPMYWNPYPAGKRRPNAWGLFDTLGNVREWVGDAYSPSEAVVRGGGRRISERSGLDREVLDHLVGFRCAGDLR